MHANALCELKFYLTQPSLILEFTLIEASFEEWCSCEVMLLPPEKENDGHTWYFCTLYTV